MTRKDRIKALFKLAPGIEISGGDVFDIVGAGINLSLTEDILRELETDGFLAGRSSIGSDGRWRRLYSLAPSPLSPNPAEPALAVGR
jgi:hypothetical protein